MGDVNEVVLYLTALVLLWDRMSFVNIVCLMCSVFFPPLILGALAF